MNKLILTLLAGTTFSSTLVLAQGVPAPGSAESLKKVMVIAHRGEHLKHPENTMPAFQAAIDAGADFFELDVRTTSDGRLVLMHDRTVDRTTNGTGAVREMTFA